MPTTTHLRRRVRCLGADGAPRHDVDPTPQLAASGRGRNNAAIVLAVLSIAVGALGGVVVYKAGSSRQSVLAAVHAISAGHVLAASDLRVVDVSTDGGLAFVLAADEDTVVGRPAAVPVAAGAPLTGSELGPMPAVPQGEAVIGVLCKDGEYPPSLAPGDTVELVESAVAVGSTGSSTQPGASSGALAVPTLEATVIGVDPPTDTATVGMVISLRLDASAAPSVARAAAAGTVSLILVPPGG